MNDMARRIVMDRMRRGDRRGGDYRGDMRGEMREDRRGDYRGDMRGDYRGNMEYRGEVEYDERRGVRGTGRYGMGGRDYEGDHRGRDYGEDDDETRLSKTELKRWKKMLKNADGSSGEHFTMDHVTEAARQIGVKFDGYDETELCMTANMLYSDLAEALRSIIPRDKEALIYTKMAKCWLEDDDGPEGSEKLALYFWCIVDDDES